MNKYLEKIAAAPLRRFEQLGRAGANRLYKAYPANGIPDAETVLTAPLFSPRTNLTMILSGRKGIKETIKGGVANFHLGLIRKKNELARTALRTAAKQGK